VVDGKLVGYGKAVKQVGYGEFLEAGHYVLKDQIKYIGPLVNNWI